MSSKPLLGPERAASNTTAKLDATSTVPQTSGERESDVRATPGAAPSQIVVLLDPSSVSIPLTPNRARDAFETDAYRELRDSVVASGGNMVPIEVRRTNREGSGQPTYELVYGERRLRACVHARLPVRAIVSHDHAGDESFLRRMRENRGRADLAPLEFGRQVKHVLDGPQGLNRSMLADQLGCSVSLVSRAYDLASLPECILAAFESAHDLRYEHVKVLRDAYKQDPQALEAEARRLRSDGQRLAPQEVVMRLVRAATPAFASCKQDPRESRHELQCDGRKVGSWSVTARGVELQIELAMSDAQRSALGEHVTTFLERKVLGRKAAALPTRHRQQNPQDNKTQLAAADLPKA
jgi:ParB family transcriptional regulator, chromosome partitioning protein